MLIVKIKINDYNITILNNLKTINDSYNDAEIAKNNFENGANKSRLARTAIAVASASSS